MNTSYQTHSINKNIICKSKLLTVFLLMLFINSEAQTYTQTQLQQTYWNYRDRFRKMFVAIGNNPGESYPYENIDPNFEVTPYNFNPSNPSQFPIIKGSANYGDANITHGFYLAVLATEYYLLKTQGNDKKSLIACQNELYFALQAINRVDRLSGGYYNKVSVNPDGFLTRGDVNSDFLNRCRTLFNSGFTSKCGWITSDGFQGVDIVSLNTVGGVRIGTTADGSQFNIDANEDPKRRIHHQIVGFDKNDASAFGNFRHEMSQDHYTGLLFGLYFVFKFVDNELVSPNSNFPPLRLKDETKSIVKRLTDFINMPKSVDIIDETDEFDHEKFKAIENAKWVLSNPHENKVVMRGGNSYLLGLNYPWAEIANEILNTNSYQKASGNYTKVKLNNSSTNAPILNQKIAFLSGFALQKLNQVNQIRTAGYSKYIGKNIFNYNMFFKLGTMSQILSKDVVVEHADFIFQNKGDLWQLLYEGLHHQQPSSSLNGMLGLFNELSLYDINNFNNNIDFKDNAPSEGWMVENKFNMYSGSIGDKETKIQIGEFNGLDFMLAHNLIRMLYPMEGFENTSNQNGQYCLVTSTLLDNNKSLISNLNFSFTTQSFNTNYREYKIPVPEYLSHSVQINTTNGKLNVLGDLWVCDGGVVELNNNGQLGFVSLGSNPSREIKFKKNSELIIKQDGKLIIENNTIVKIEPDAILTIHPGAQIILNGPNAVIHINGKMILKQDAEFNPIAGTNGYGKVIFENHVGEVYVKCEGNNKVIINPGTRGPHLNLEVIGAHGMHAGWQPGLRLFEIKNAKVGLAPGSKITSEADRTVIDNIQMEGKNWPQNESEYSKGLVLISTSTNIQNSHFDFLEDALEFKYHPYAQMPFRPIVKNNTFWRCKNGIKLNDGRLLAEGNQFSAHKIGVRGIYAVTPLSSNVIKENRFDIEFNNSTNQWRWSPTAPKMSIQFHNIGRVNISKNNFQSSTYGVYSMDGNLTLSCNFFNGWNNISNANYAIKARNGRAIMTEGYNLFQNYQTYLYAQTCRLGLNNGYNLFDIKSSSYPFNIVLSPYHLTFNCVDFDLTLDKENDEAIKATNNYWLYPNTLIESSLFRPYSQPNENIYIVKNGMFYDLGYNPNLNTGGNYMGIKDDFCNQVVTFDPRTLEKAPNLYGSVFGDIFGQTNPYFEGLIVPIRPPSIGTGETYNEVLSARILSISDGIIDYTTVLPDLAHLTKIDIPTYLSDVSYYTYSLMHEIYGDGLHDTLNHDSMSVYINTFGNMLLANQDTLINKCLNNDSFWSSMRYELFRDKAMLLRSLDRRDEAIVLLDSAIVDSLIPDMLKSHATAWRCVINQEVMLIDSVITIADIDFELCMPEDSMQNNSPYTYIESDTTFYLCNADSINGNNLTMSYTVLDTLPFVVYNYYSDTIFADTLQQFTLPIGDYTIVATDTGAQIIYMHYIHVTQNRDCYPEVIEPTYTSTDTTFYLCYDGVQPLDSVYFVYQADSTLPYVLIKNSSDTISHNMNHQYQLSFGNYNFAYVDTLLNIFNNDYVKIDFDDSCTVVPEEYTFQIIDTTFSICYIDSSNIDLLTYHYLPDTTLPYTIYNEYIDTIFTDTIHSYRLPLGNYVYVAIDSINRVLHLTYLNIVFDSICFPPDTIFQTSDTSYFICNTGSASLHVTYPIDTHLTHQVLDESNATVSEYSPYLYQLTEGSYTIVTLDTSTYTKHTRTVQILVDTPAVFHFVDTIIFNCYVIPYSFSIYNDETTVYLDNVLEDTVLYRNYELDPLAGQYTVRYNNYDQCRVDYTDLYFDDEPMTPTDPAILVLAKYDRTEDSCVFVKLNQLNCLGDTIKIGQIFEVYDMGSQLLFSATIEAYSMNTKGFRFCPPHWNTSSGHINDWKFLTYQISNCEYCRIDFRPDSMVIFPYVLSLDEEQKMQQVSIYPNPSNSKVVVKVKNSNQTKITIQITDNMGRLIINEIKSINDNGEIPLSLENYSNGIYFIKIPELNFDGKVVLIKE